MSAGADKEALFAAARVFAMTSLSENFGIAAFEAMRRGVPVLTTADVGMSEIVRATPRRVWSSTRHRPPSRPACARCSRMPREAGQGERGRAVVVDHYGWSTVAHRMEALYRSIGRRLPGGEAGA